MLISNICVTIICFVIFNLVYVQLPGLVLLGESDRKLTSEARLLISYFLGMGLLTAEYYLCSVPGWFAVFKIVNPCISLYWICCLVRRRSELKLSRSGGLPEQKLSRSEGLPVPKLRISRGLPVLMAVTLALSMLLLNVVGVDLHALKSVRFPHDFVWHISNVASASKGAFFDDARLAGHVFYYHFFGDLLLGMCKKIFPMITAFDLVMRCTPFLVSYIFSIGLYALAQNRAKRPLLVCALFYCAGFAIDTMLLDHGTGTSLLNFHVLTNVNGMALSLPSIIALYLYVFEWRGAGDKLYYLNLFLLSAAASGIKGPAALVLVAAIFGTVVIRALLCRVMRPEPAAEEAVGKCGGGVSRYALLWKSLVVLAAFAAVYVLVIEGAGNLLKESSNNRAVAFSLSRTFMLSPLGKAICHLREMGIPGKAMYGLMALTLGSVEMIGPLFLIFAGESLKDGVRMAAGKEMPPDDALTDILAGWIGIGGFWFLAQEGLSQMYFLFVAILFVLKYCFHAARRLQGRIVGRVIAAACVRWLLLGTRALLNQVRFAIADNTERRSEWMAEGDRSNPGYLTAGELEAMEWIRDHTPKDSVLAVDRQSLRSGGVTSEDDCRFFYYSAFSERSVYLEGFSYSDADSGLIEERLAVNNRIYKATGSDFREAVREAGVDYIVVTKRLAEAAGGLEGAVKPVFSNEDIEIYEVGQSLQRKN